MRFDSFRFQLLHWELGVSARPSLYYSKGSQVLLDPFGNSFFFDGYPLNVLSRRLGPGTKSCCGASRDLE